MNDIPWFPLLLLVIIISIAITALYNMYSIQSVTTPVVIVITDTEITAVGSMTNMLMRRIDESSTNVQTNEEVELKQKNGIIFIKARGATIKVTKDSFEVVDVDGGIQSGSIKPDSEMKASQGSVEIEQKGDVITITIK